MNIEETIKIVRARRLYYMQQAKLYQRLSVSPEHWHTARKEAYRDSSDAFKLYAKAMWYSWQALKKLNSDQNAQASVATEADSNTKVDNQK